MEMSRHQISTITTVFPASAFKRTRPLLISAVLAALLALSGLTPALLGQVKKPFFVRISRAEGWDGYRSKFENIIEKGISRLFFGYSATIAEISCENLCLWSMFDSENATTYDRDEFTRPATIITVDRGRSNLERLLGLRYEYGDGKWLILENKRHDADYDHNFTEGLTRAIATSIVYDDTTLSLMRDYGRYGPMEISLGLFLEAGRDNHVNRIKRVTNYLAGPALDLKFEGGLLKSSGFKSSFVLDLEVSGGLGIQSHGPGDWALVVSGHGRAQAGITAEF